MDNAILWSIRNNIRNNIDYAAMASYLSVIEGNVCSISLLRD